MALSRTTRVNLLLGNGHFLSHFYALVPAAAVPGMAGGIPGELRRTRPCGRADVRVDRTVADAGRISGGSLWRASVPDRRRAGDVAVHHRHGICHQLLADPAAGAALGHGQFGVPPGGLCDPVGLGGQGPHGPRICAAHVQRQPGLCGRATDHGAAGGDDRLARQPDPGRAARHPGGGVHRAAERHPEGSGSPRGRACRADAVRPRAADEPHDAAVLRLLPAGLDGGRRRAVLADHGAPHGEGPDAGNRVRRR